LCGGLFDEEISTSRPLFEYSITKMYVLITLTNQRNKELKNKDQEKSRNKYNKTKQNQTNGKKS